MLMRRQHGEFVQVPVSIGAQLLLALRRGGQTYGNVVIFIDLAGLNPTRCQSRVAPDESSECKHSWTITIADRVVVAPLHPLLA
jgi:hypothetical protein